jgi:hypothetical protein
MRFLILTTGKGVLPAGRVIGAIDACNVKDARAAIARQVPAEWADKWRFAEDKP